jgi:dolichol-phosphate mannosyltransferase
MIHNTAPASVSLAIVCPMANEASTAAAFVPAVLANCTGFKSVALFAVLDNASHDSTLEILRGLASSDSRIRVIWAPENRCVAEAYLRGYKEAIAEGSEWFLEIDAGFSHQPNDIPTFFEAMLHGRDCVFGTRFGKGGKMVDSSTSRRLISFGGTLLSNIFLGTKMTDMTSGFQLFARPVIMSILAKGIRSKGPFFQTEMKAYCKALNYEEVPITYRTASHAVKLNSILESFDGLTRLFLARLRGQLAIQPSKLSGDAAL